MKKNVRAAALFTALAVAGSALGGCSVSRVGNDGMRTTGSVLPIVGIGVLKRDMDEPAGRANVIAAGLANPNSKVRDVTAEMTCAAKNSQLPQVERAREAALVDKVTGNPSIPCVVPK